jgi:hypothetical protein
MSIFIVCTFWEALGGDTQSMGYATFPSSNAVKGLRSAAHLGRYVVAPRFARIISRAAANPGWQPL